jgi:Dihaem cytochrome c
VGLGVGGTGDGTGPALILTLIFRLNMFASMARPQTALRASLAIALASAALAGGCGAGLPAATDADAARARRTWSDVSVSELELGRHLYATRCSVCHALYQPIRFPAARWRSLVSAMSERARLWPADGEAVTRYLMVKAEGQGCGRSLASQGQPQPGVSHAE